MSKIRDEVIEILEVVNSDDPDYPSEHPPPVDTSEDRTIVLVLHTEKHPWLPDEPPDDIRFDLRQQIYDYESLMKVIGESEGYELRFGWSGGQPSILTVDTGIGAVSGHQFLTEYWVAPPAAQRYIDEQGISHGSLAASLGGTLLEKPILETFEHVSDTDEIS